MYDLSIEAVKFSYSNRVILDSSFINFPGNSVSGLVGANGQGKTTLFKIITGGIKADYLQLFYNKKRVEPSSDGYKNFTYLNQDEFFPRQLRVDRLIDIMTIEEGDKRFLKDRFSAFKNKRIRELSAGQKRILEIYYTLKTEQPVKLLDEPFRGLDPKTIEEITTYIKEIRDKTIIITSHLLPELKNVTSNLFSLQMGSIRRIADHEDVLELIGHKQR